MNINQLQGSNGGIEPYRILVVDDNPATLYSTSRVIRSAGWTALEAESGNAALEQVQQGIDLVILDVNLPDFDGFEVCRRIRANSETARLPVVHLSATFVKDVDKVHGLDSGADGYLTHPVEPPVLIATVNAFLRTRRAEAELRRSEARFKAVFENARSGIALLDSDLGFVDANPAMCEMLGITHEQLRSTPFSSVTEEVRSISDALQSTAYWGGIVPTGGEPGAENSRHLEWSISRHEGPEAWLAIATDVSEQLAFELEREQLLDAERSARGEAEQANRLKDDFLATLSHELRTPLNAIVGWSQLLLLDSSDAQEVREGLEAIERNAKAQATMIADLLDVSRITSGKMRLDVQQVDLISTIDAALETVGAAIAGKDLRISKVLDPAAGPISGDPNRLQQIVWNLLSNAIKFTPKGGRIAVRLSKIDSHVEIAIEDNGIGIRADDLPHVFERFHQVDASSSREYGGLGLGLAIVKQLIELHGGSIKADSPGPALGATFTVVLPVVAVQQVATNRSSSRLGNEGISLEGIRVLFVDDDADARALYRRILNGTKAESHAASSAAEALDAIATFEPNIIVSDLGMPIQDGFALMREVRARGFDMHSLPAIALTAFTRTQERRRALMAGFQLHLSKPVDPAELLAAIASLTGRTGSAD